VGRSKRFFGRDQETCRHRHRREDPDCSVGEGCSGSIAKHHHAVLLAEYLTASGIPLCPACQEHDGRRAAALIERPEYKNLSVEQILLGCGLFDAHGFLVPAKKANSKKGTEARHRRTKHSLVECSFALGLPERYTLLSPDGAMTATMLSHLTGLEGVIVVRKDV